MGKAPFLCGAASPPPLPLLLPPTFPESGRPQISATQGVGFVNASLSGPPDPDYWMFSQPHASQQLQAEDSAPITRAPFRTERAQSNPNVGAADCSTQSSYSELSKAFGTPLF